MAVNVYSVICAGVPASPRPAEDDGVMDDDGAEDGDTVEDGGV